MFNVTDTLRIEMVTPLTPCQLLNVSIPEGREKGQARGHIEDDCYWSLEQGTRGYGDVFAYASGLVECGKDLACMW